YSKEKLANMVLQTEHLRRPTAESTPPRPLLEAPTRATGTHALEGAGLRPEQATSAAEVQHAFTEAGTLMYKIGVDPGFQAFCVARNIDHEASERPEYWDAFAEFTSRRVDTLIQKGAPRAKLRALELMALTPQFIQTQHGLRGTNDRRRYDVGVASR